MANEQEHNETNAPVEPVPSEWRCYLFGNKPGSAGLLWRPAKGDEPNWFWRTMQYLFFGNLWVKGDD